MSRYNKDLGDFGEKTSVQYLKDNGYAIICEKYNTNGGEIDIIAENEKYLVFIEVKYRSSSAKGLPEEAVTQSKMRTISRVADYYRLRHGYGEDTPCRFDVVAVLGQEIKLYENAFPYVGSDW